MGPILCLDSSAGKGVLGLVFSPVKPVVFRTFLSGKGVHASLSGQVSNLLEDFSLKTRDLAAVLVGVGPGSYTGLRRAGAFAQTLSFAHNIPLYPLSSLSFFSPQEWESSYVVLSDAKRGDVYASFVTEVQGNLCFGEVKRLPIRGLLKVFPENKYWCAPVLSPSLEKACLEEGVVLEEGVLAENFLRTYACCPEVEVRKALSLLYLQEPFVQH